MFYSDSHQGALEQEHTGDNPGLTPGRENAAICSTKGHALTSGSACLFAALVLEGLSFVGADAFVRAGCELLISHSLLSWGQETSVGCYLSTCSFCFCVCSLVAKTFPKYYLTWVGYLFAQNLPKPGSSSHPSLLSPERPKSEYPCHMKCLWQKEQQLISLERLAGFSCLL